MTTKELLFEKFRNIAKSKDRNFLINKLIEISEIRQGDLDGKHKNRIEFIWASLMAEKAKSAISM